MVHMRDLLVHPIHRQHILYQIVRPDAEEIGFPANISEMVTCRHFNHDADLNVWIVCDAALVQIGHRTPQTALLDFSIEDIGRT